MYKSCGSAGCIASARFKENYKGLKFGALTVLENIYIPGNKNATWKCLCDCGNVYQAQAKHIKEKGELASCGCMTKNGRSNGEMLISRLLEDNNVPFIIEKTFPNCKKISHLRFDFYVNNSYLIEFDGKQHYSPVRIWGGEEALQIRQEYDAYKNQWCHENGIPLIRIPYWKLSTLTARDITLETTQFRVV